MASGIPLVSTRVGQASDLICHAENGWLVDVEDAEGLAYWAEKVLIDSGRQDKILPNALKTAEFNSYERQLKLWETFFHGFVD